LLLIVFYHITVLVILQSGGGTVTGYGLATAQLLRIKEAGLKLNIAVEQVAASGGYMMCCVADRIFASPFAVLGSIGVISDIPNVYERLKLEGIEFQTVTAGKYKRTLTPTKKVSKEDFAKTKADVEDIFALFRDFVGKNRPQLDIEAVATGETWFGTDALERNLCDEIKAVDSVITEYIDKSYDVFEIDYKPPIESPFGNLLAPSSQTSKDTGVVGRAIRWLVRTVAEEFRSELLTTGSNVQKPVEEQYMAMDDTSERIRSD
jgi:serine protease SohB